MRKTFSHQNGYLKFIISAVAVIGFFSQVTTAPKGDTETISSHKEIKLDQETENPELIAAKINIRTASAEQLMSLPGIGKVLASRIIEFREKHQITRIEDILSIRGIGVKRFEAIKSLICL